MEARNTVDSGIEFTENRHDLLPFQPGGRKRHADDDTLLRTYADRPTNTRNIQWDGRHKQILIESEDPESTLSGSETQEVRPGWPPDDMCADSTRYRGSFDDRDSEGLQLLSPVFQQKVLKLQRDLEEAKAESQYFRARGIDTSGCSEPTTIYVHTRHGVIVISNRNRGHNYDYDCELVIVIDYIHGKYNVIAIVIDYFTKVIKIMITYHDYMIFFPFIFITVTYIL